MPKKTTSIDIVNLSVPRIPVEETQVDRTIDVFKRFGSDNLFPQKIALINRTTITHRGILKNKTIYTVGKGFNVSEGNEPLRDYIKNVNANNESLKDVYKKFVFDFYGWGNAYLEFVTNSSREFFNIFHRQSVRARLSKDAKSVIFHPDWSRYQGHKNLATTIPLYPNFEEINGNLRSILHVKSYEPEFTFYGLPEWLGAMDAAAIGFKTNKWNISRLDNQFQVSALLEVFGDESDEELKKGIKAAKKELTGEGNNAKLLVIRKHPGGEATKYTPFVQTSEGEWINLHKQSDQDLIIAHNWFRSLTSLSEPGQLGNTQQIRNEYAIAKATVIDETNDTLLSQIKLVLDNETSFEVEDLTVNNQNPINITDLLDLDFVVTIGEARKLLGLPVDEDDPRMNEPIKKQKDGSISISTGGN